MPPFSLSTPIVMEPTHIAILILCAALGLLALDYTLTETVLLLLAIGAVLSLIWLAFVLAAAL